MFGFFFKSMFTKDYFLPIHFQFWILPTILFTFAINLYSKGAEAIFVTILVTVSLAISLGAYWICLLEKYPFLAFAYWVVYLFFILCTGTPIGAAQIIYFVAAGIVWVINVFGILR